MQGAVVVGRTNDRDFWTFSAPSDANGHYTSLFHASDELDEDPVPINIGVALGQMSYGGNLGTAANFARNQSATLDIQLEHRDALHAREAGLVSPARSTKGPPSASRSRTASSSRVAARWPTRRVASR